MTSEPTKGDGDLATVEKEWKNVFLQVGSDWVKDD